MSLLTYVRSLTSSFKKNDILTGVEFTSHALRETTLPAFKSAELFFKEHPISSTDAKNLVTRYEKAMGKNGSLGVVGDIQAALSNAVDILTFIGAEAKSEFNEAEANISLTYVKATYLRLIEGIEFASSYALKWLNVIYTYETAGQDGNVKVRDNLAPAELKWLDDHADDFFTALAVMQMEVKDIEKGVKGLPDATITELTESTFPSTVGQGKVDPFQLRNFSAAVNPFYLFGMMRAERQASRYKAKVAEAQLLELRLLNLRKIYDKSPDARLQREIEHTVGRVARLNYDNAKFEKDYLQ